MSSSPPNQWHPSLHRDPPNTPSTLELCRRDSLASVEEVWQQKFWIKIDDFVCHSSCNCSSPFLLKGAAVRDNTKLEMSMASIPSKRRGRALHNDINKMRGTQQQWWWWQHKDNNNAAIATDKQDYECWCHQKHKNQPLHQGSLLRRHQQRWYNERDMTMMMRRTTQQQWWHCQCRRQGGWWVLTPSKT